MGDNYKQYSLVQAIVILICGISVFDFGLLLGDEDFGFNEALFENSDTVYWSIFVFWGYCFLVVGLLQLFKALDHD